MKHCQLWRDYEVPKHPMFTLKNMEVVQSHDASAYVSNSVTDSVMYGTNGNIGLRHRSEMETCGFETSVLMNGVYHLASRETMVDCAALTHDRQTGAEVCSVDLDLLVDGESGTLSSIPIRRLSLKDGAYRALCEDVMSADGGLMFNTSYTRTVGTSDLEIWAAEVVHDNFRIMDREPEIEDYSGTFSPSSHGSWNRYGNSAVNVSSFNVCNTAPSPVTYRLEIVAMVAIVLDEWEVLKAAQMDEIWQRSISSNVIVNTTSNVQCEVQYENGEVNQLSPEVEILACSEGIDSEASPISFDHYAPSIYTKNSNSELFTLTGEQLQSNGGATKVKGKSDRIPGQSKEAPRKFLIKKRYFLDVKESDVPKKITLTFKARHSKGKPTNTSPFPSVLSIIEDRRKSLEPFLENFNVDLQLQDDLVPDRTKLALLYNASRLFSVSHNLENGLPCSGCSAGGDGLLYNLGHYIYFFFYYIFTSPPSALSLLKHVYRMLPVCRTNAENLCLPHGAVFPLHTIKGTNCRRYSTFNNTRLPVNADIGTMISTYFAAVEDISEEDRMWLLELMLETARVWLFLGEWREDRTYFRLENIAGTDEYNGSVSGNFYVHLSAKSQMRRACQLFRRTEGIVGTEKMNALLQQISMTREELLEMNEASEAIVVRRSDRLKVFMVHDYFHKLAPWKGGAQHPLSANYHPLAIYRHKLIDIPEVLVGLLLNEQMFETVDFENNYNYYLPLCTFDSPESLGIFAICECRSRGAHAQPIPFLRSLANLDLDDITYAADEGLHFGALTVSLLTLLLGLGGVTVTNGQLKVSPILPAGVLSYRFSVCFKGCVLGVNLTEEKLTYELKSGDSLRFLHGPSCQRLHLHTGFRTFEANRVMSIPRNNLSQSNVFEGVVFLADSLFLNLYEYNYVSWFRVLETLFETYRTLQNRPIPPLNPKEYIEKVVYQKESAEIAFSGVHNILLSRGIDLELGTPDDAEIVETRYGLANAKVAEMAELLESQPPQINPQLFELLQNLERDKISMAIVTYSRSLRQLVNNSPWDLSRYFIANIDGEEAHDRHIKARPHVDLYLKAAEKLHVAPNRCLVFSHHLDKDYSADEMGKFKMFLDIEDPFVSSREELSEFPTLSPENCEKLQRTNPVVCRLLLSKMPSTVDQLEDVVDGRISFSK